MSSSPLGEKLRVAYPFGVGLHLDFQCIKNAKEILQRNLHFALFPTFCIVRLSRPSLSANSRCETPAASLAAVIALATRKR